MQPEHRRNLRDLLARLQSGDEEAASDLVAEYEPEILREVRLRLRGRGLRAAYDSTDVVQSVLAGFMLRVATGRCRLESRDDLTRYLVRLARNKVVSLTRWAYAARRDERRNESLGERAGAISGGEAEPGDAAEYRELVAAFRSRLSDEERQIAEMRRTGADWEAVALRFGGSPASQRMRVARVIRRVKSELGLDED